MYMYVHLFLTADDTKATMYYCIYYTLHRLEQLSKLICERYQQMNETSCDCAVARHQSLEEVRETTLWPGSPHPFLTDVDAYATIELLMGSALRTTRAKLLTSTARKRWLSRNASFMA